MLQQRLWHEFAHLEDFILVVLETLYIKERGGETSLCTPGVVHSLCFRYLLAA